ncbi:hypothetical protein FG386_001428 [Cryptosporidium ryanae]|uniref:uncharacterized protein n=1 Tax=Cryptosporidium ryanae TaxID=515981 RepID=UPI00351A7951|nr:hypothetical protein FG386_001428 [Cryptosporidium ryanae]
MYYKRCILFFFSLSFFLFLLVNYDRGRLSRLGPHFVSLDQQLESFSDETVILADNIPLKEDIVNSSLFNVGNYNESTFAVIKEALPYSLLNSVNEEVKTYITHSFKFPFRLNPNGFRLLMKIKVESTFHPITIVFIGKDLKRLINIVIESCKLHIFSKNRKGTHFYDSSPLLHPIKSTNYIELIMDWFDETYILSTLNNGYQIALVNNVRVNSPLINAGFSFIGREFKPITIEWVFENNPFFSNFTCEIGYYEGRCKSYSIDILENKHKNFEGMSVNEGFIKVAFQYPPNYKIPVKLAIGKEGLVIEFHYEKLIIRFNSDTLETHFFSDKYEEGEWLNLDLVPISTDLINYIDSTTQDKLKTSTQKYDSNSSENSSYCFKEVLGNINRHSRIIFRNTNYYFPNETSIKSKDGKPNTYKLFFAIDNEIIGK